MKMAIPFDRVFSLYRESFPANERRSESDLRRALAGPDYRVWAREDAGTLVGFAIVFVPADQNFALLEYLAVVPIRQSAGIGRELVNESIAATRGRCLLTEVESATDDSVTVRRQRFYEKCNFRRIAGLKYQLPLPGNPPPMELWANPISAMNRVGLENWIRAIYTDVYHCRPDDPRITQMLNLTA
jgi:predicted N-acetyltransferase YhbS